MTVVNVAAMLAERTLRRKSGGRVRFGVAFSAFYLALLYRHLLIS